MYSGKIRNMDHLKQCIKEARVQIDGNATLMDQVHNIFLQVLKNAQPMMDNTLNIYSNANLFSHIVSHVLKTYVFPIFACV